MKKNLSALLALLLCAMPVLSACQKEAPANDYEQQIAALTQENAALKEQVDVLTRQLESIQNAVLTDWDLTAKASSDRNSAVLSFSAVPAVAPEGQTVSLVVLLNGFEAESVQCAPQDGTYYGTLTLPAADGYSYYCLLSSPNGSRQLPLTGPNTPDAGIPVYLQTSLSAYSNLVVNNWIENPGSTLVLTDAYAQVQLPQISADGAVQIVTAEVVLRLNGVESARIPIKLAPSEVAGSFDLTITDLQIPMPELEQGDVLELSLEVNLSDGRRLNAFGITWTSENGKLTSAVG